MLEVKVILCPTCLERSGRGELVKIYYTNSGGYSPSWEGRVCEHLTADSAIDYLKAMGRPQVR